MRSSQCRCRRWPVAPTKRGLLAEAGTASAEQSWRSDGDLQFALTITDTGLEAIGLGEMNEPGEGTGSTNPAGAAPMQPAPPRTSCKIAKVIAPLKRGEGATLAELVAATDWLPHTTRAALPCSQVRGRTRNERVAASNALIGDRERQLRRR